MIRVKQIKELNLDLTKDNKVLITLDDEVVNTLSFSSDYSTNSLVQRDNNGRIKINNPLEDLDAVNKRYLTQELSKIAFSGFSNSQSISFSKDDSGKYVARAILPADGKILKVGGSGNQFVAANYIYETENRVVISKNQSRIGSTIAAIKGTTCTVESNKQNDSGNDIAIATGSKDLNDGPTFATYAYYHSTASTYVKENQLLSKFTVNGANSSSTFFNALDFSVKANSDFNTTPSSRIEIKQDGENLLKTDEDQNIILYNSLVLGSVGNEINGSIYFDGSHFLGYNGTTWVPLDSTSTDSYITSTIYSNYNVGAVTIGDKFTYGMTLEDVVKKIFNPNSFISFDIDFGTTAYVEDGGALEVGQPVTVSEATFVDNCDFDYVEIDGNGFDSSVYYTDSPIEATELTKTFTIENGDYTWILSGIKGEVVDTPEDLPQKTFTVYGRYRTCFGANAISLLLNPSMAQTVISSLNYELVDKFIGKGVSFTTDSDNKDSSKYTYIAYPSDWGNLNAIFMHGVPIFDAFTYVGVFAYNNPNNVSIMYKVYQSNATGAFRNTTKLTFK